MTHQVFLSYSSSNRDREIARVVALELKKLGVSSFDPSQDLKAGEDWRKSILNAIRKTEALFVFVTEPFATASSWMGYEIGTANAFGKNVVVVKSPSISAGDLPTDLASWRMVDFDPSSPASTARTLASSLAIAA